MNKLYINILLANALLQMYEYWKFMKELLKKKRVSDLGTIEVFNYGSHVMSINLVSKIKDSRVLLLCAPLGFHKFVNINLMSFVIFKKLGLKNPKLTLMKFQMRDHSTKKSVGILFDMLVKVDQFIILDNF